MILYPSPSSCHLICHLAGRRWVWMSKSKMIQKTCPCAACSTGACPLRFSLRGKKYLAYPRWLRLWSRYTGVSEPITKKPCSLSKPTCAYILTLAKCKSFQVFHWWKLREMHRLTRNLRDIEFHSRSLTPNAAFWMRCVEFSSAMMRHRCVFGMASEVAV